MTVQIAITTDVESCLDLRKEVFVAEQNVPLEEELDDLDDVSTHFLAIDETGKPVGTARVFEVGETGKIGRVCVVKSLRGTGLGARLIETCLAELAKRPHLTEVRLGAQCYAIPFYARFGFEVCSDEYMDGGIPHQDMIRPL